jgi:hypothetical protein
MGWLNYLRRSCLLLLHCPPGCCQGWVASSGSVRVQCRLRRLLLPTRQPSLLLRRLPPRRLAACWVLLLLCWETGLLRD